MTYWTEDGTHPGNEVALGKGRPNPIKKWADNGEAFLIFPSEGTQAVLDGFAAPHDLFRWNLFSPKFRKVGRCKYT